MPHCRPSRRRGSRFSWNSLELNGINQLRAHEVNRNQRISRSGCRPSVSKTSIVLVSRVSDRIAIHHSSNPNQMLLYLEGYAVHQ
jgi:hypothetical protein